ncbi:hypothetical protein BASA82_000752 [Batrachochytrium salamandrivorans]|nr:hypothetical protein BASA62_005855 [Batrachochytrium salamandrivorans]KAH9262208.1 hypothetical protein BASA82_000752 [Batrachochytrium salamandrivorans]KAH9267154.1 hypothetical protein BASA84_000798 [Batrachochytrium salamandrivorans]
MATATIAPLRVFEEWESSHSLTEKQLDSIALLKRHCTELPIPTELAAQSPQRQEGASAEPDVLGPTTGIDPPAATAGTVAGKMSEAPHTTAMLTRPDKDSTVGGKPASSPSSSSVLTIAETIETTQQFLAWFAKVEEEMERGQEDVYRACLATVRGYRDATANILINTSHTSALLDDLETNYNFIEEKTKGLQISCETLLDEQTHLIGVTEELSAKLAYFNELDPITRMLNAPGETIVLDEKFGPMLQKLDQCLSFVMQHLHYKDAEIYRMRYRQCMTRSITLVKMHFVNVIRGLQQDIGEKLEGRQTHEPLPMNMQLTLFYVKFRTLASKIKHLLGEIEERCNEHTEYLVLLRDCFTAYFVARRTLLSPFISAHIMSLNASSSGLLDFTESGCAYMIRLCADEYQLFRQFFRLGEEDILEYMERIAMGLYEHLRPLIIREIKLDTLSDMCQSLQSYIKTLDSETETVGDSGDLVHVNSSPVRFVVGKILQDAQQRLAFRAETFIQQELQKFRPRESELRVLARGRGLPQPAEINLTMGVAPVLSNSLELSSARRSTGGDSLYVSPLETSLSANLEASLEPAEMQGSGAFVIGKLAYGGGEWYPTLQRTLYVLGRLYGAVPGPVFEDLAQEAVDLCRQSLVEAAGILSSKESQIDGQLFLIKNLLMLREQTSMFDARFVRKEDTLNFSDMVEAFKGVVRNSFRVSAMSTIGDAFMVARATKVVQSYADAKDALDKELRRVCEDLILETAKSSVEPISAFMLKVSAFRLRNNSRPMSSRDVLKNQSFAQPNQIGAIFTAFKDIAQRRLVFTVSRISDYLGDKKTQSVLIRIIRSNIVDTYQAFVDIVSAEYDASTNARIVSIADMTLLIDLACEQGLMATPALPLEKPISVSPMVRASSTEAEGVPHIEPIALSTAPTTTD